MASVAGNSSRLVIWGVAVLTKVSLAARSFLEWTTDDPAV